MFVVDYITVVISNYIEKRKSKYELCHSILINLKAVPHLFTTASRQFQIGSLMETKQPDQIVEQIQLISSVYENFQYSDELIINNYPIGGRNRGRCKLGIEYAHGHGTRLIRTTENAHGDWNQPHYSNYQKVNVLLAVDVRNLIAPIKGTIFKKAERRSITGMEFTKGKPFTGWISSSKSGGIYLRAANYDCFILVEAPSSTFPAHQDTNVPSAAELLWDAYVDAMVETQQFFQKIRNHCYF